MGHNGRERDTAGLFALLRDSRGNIMPIAGVALVTLAAMVGSGVDVSRAYMTQNRLQNACDAGVLAGRRAVESDGYDEDAKAQADAFFDTNFDEEEQGVSSVSFFSTTEDGGNTIIGTASTDVDTVIMQLFGFTDIPLSVNCQASMSIGNADVVMVLDNTGSMAWDLDGSQTRLEALQEAMKSFYDTVSAAADGGNGRLRFGFVPFSSSVNVGHLLYDEDPSWLVDSWTYQSREPKFVTTSYDEVTGYKAPYYTNDTSTSDLNYDNWAYYNGTKYDRSWQCENAMPSDTPWQNSSSSTTSTSTYTNGNKQRITTTTKSQPQQRYKYACYERYDKYYIIYRRETRKYNEIQYKIEDPIYTTKTYSTFDHWEYKPVTYDTSTFKAFSSVTTPTGSNGSNQSSTWDGCVEERKSVAQGSFSYSALTGLSPSNAYDLDIDMAPTSSNDTKWRPMWSQISYYRTTSNGYYLTNSSPTDRGGKASSACPFGARLLSEMSEDQFDDYTDSLVPVGGTYLDIGMIWGGRLSSPTGIFADNVNEAPANNGKVSRHIIFMTDGEMDTSYSSDTMYGIEYHDRRVTSDGYSNQNDRHTARFKAVCDQIKAKGIRIWVIAFTSNLTSDLQYCASPQSSYTASNAASLNAAFQDIGKTVGELRITQ